MENHPIPQDVTGFQFKLVGNMTVKQFAYIATGAVLAVVTYYLPILLVIKFPFILLFAGVGAALAFLPIEGRPMDMMVSNFVHDLFVPTQYLYHKQGGHLAISTVQIIKPATQQQASQTKKVTQADIKRAQQLAALLQNTAHKGRTALDDKEDQFLQAITSLSTNPQLLSTFQAQGSMQTHDLSSEEKERVKQAQSPEDDEKDLEREAEELKKELELARQQEIQLEKNHQPIQEVHQEVSKLQSELNDILEQKQQLENELLRLKEQMEQPKTSEAQLTDQVQAPPQSSENVRTVPTDKAATVGLITLPRDPNLILGIIKDSRGNVLPNILVEIKDTEGTPVRAFKTNGLGQFASATPLTNGSYTIEFEDPRGINKFEVVAIEATGEILLPLEIISTDDREELRKELFS